MASLALDYPEGWPQCRSERENKLLRMRPKLDGISTAHRARVKTNRKKPALSCALEQNRSTVTRTERSPFLKSIIASLIFASVLTAAAPARIKPVEEPASGSRTVLAGPADVIPLATKLRFTTVVALPEDERILDFVVGDKDWWVVDGVSNMAWVKPAKAGARTSLNLITASGNIYSFTLREVGQASESDLKVFVQPREKSGSFAIARHSGGPRLVPAEEVEAYKRNAEEAAAKVVRLENAAAERIVQVQKEAKEEIAKAKAEQPESLNFDYDFDTTPPFNVRSVFHDGRFTYIYASPEETPALYEIRDGDPSLIHYEYKSGVYRIDKILGRSYLTIGKKRVHISPRK